MTPQDKYTKIMEVMSDKTLSFGCRLNRIKYDGGFDILINTDGVLASDGYSNFVHYLSEELQPYYFEDDNVEFINNSEYNIYKNVKDEDIGRNCFLIIGHPLHIGFVIDWFEKNIHTDKQRLIEIMKLWKYKRLPLSPTDEELVDYIYNLLP